MAATTRTHEKNGHVIVDLAGRIYYGRLHETYIAEMQTGGAVAGLLQYCMRAETSSADKMLCWILICG